MSRNDYRPIPPAEKYGLSGVSYPTPNINDLVVVEDIPIRDGSYEPLLPGTPHPKNSTAKLVWQGTIKGNGHERNVRRIYATPREAQDAYNASLSFVSDDDGYPIYIRSYIEPRIGYTRATDLQPLRTLIGIQLTAGGSGYSSTTTVSITGGSGTGATAECEVINGVIVAVWVTNGGSGYTSVPTVGFSGGGSGATATALLQVNTALLIKEEATPAEGELSSLFLRVTRIYQTLPGPWLTQWITDERTGITIKVERREVARTSVSEPTNTLSSYPSGNATQRVITEFQPQTANVYVEIRSTFPSENTLAGLSQTLPVTEGHSFPNLLEDADYLWTAALDSGSGEVISFDVTLRTIIQPGYSGPCNGYLTEYYTYHPNSMVAALAAANRDITKIFTRAETIYAGLYSEASRTAKIITFVIPETLRDAITFSTPTYTGATIQAVSSLPATEPSLTEFLAMQYFIKAISVERWRGDMHIVRVLRIVNPHYVP